MSMRMALLASPLFNYAFSERHWAYGAKGNVANGLSNATFSCFPISPTAFPINFNGTNAVTNMQFDPTYPPANGLCYDEYARVVCIPSVCLVHKLSALPKHKRRRHGV